jgi:electron transfer flavoprotein beta subunit
MQMKIVVCAKRVPDSAAKIRPAADGLSIDPQGVENVISPYDEIALECAVQLKEAGVATHVTVLCLGPKEASKDVRKALALGADDAVLLLEDRPFRDPTATAEALAGALRDLAPDVVFCGWKAIDDDSSAVPGLLAAHLDYAYASFVVKVEGADGGLRVSREVEGSEEIVLVPTPCVLTAQRGLAEPRFASLKGIMQAKKKPLAEQAPVPAENASEIVAVTPPPPRPEGRVVGQGADAVPELVRILRDDVGIL